MKVVFLLCALSLFASAKPKKLQPVVSPSLTPELKLISHKVKGQVSFVAVGTPGFLKIEGGGGKLEGSFSEINGKVSGEFSVELKDLDTGIGLRNDHMKEKYLEVEKYPKASLKFNDLDSSEGIHDLVGLLTIKNVTKPAKGSYIVTNNQLKKFSGQLKIVLSDYPIGVPSYLGVSVAEDVDVKIEAEIE